MYYWGDMLLGFDGSVDAPGFKTGWVPTATSLGIPGNDLDKPYPADFKVHKPDMLDYVGDSDYRAYYLPGSSFFAGNPDEAFQKEKQTLHTAYRGDVSDWDGDLYPEAFPDSTSFSYVKSQGGGVVYPGYNTSDAGSKNYGAARIGTNAKGNGIFEVGAGSPYSFHYPTFGLQSQVAGVMARYQLYGDIDYYIYSLFTVTYRNLVDKSVFSGLSFHLDVEYDFDLAWNRIHSGGEPGSYATFHIHKIVDVGYVPFIGNRYPNDLNFPGADPFVCVDSSTVSVVSQNIRYGTTATIGSIPRMEVYSSTINGSLKQFEADSVPNFVSYRFADKRYLNRRSDLHKNLFLSLLPDLRPSSFLSSSDALNKHLLALTTNHLQTIEHLKDVLSLLPDLVKLPEMIQKIAKGDFTVLKDLVDYITDAILRYRFTQAPTAKSIEEIVGADVRGFLDNLARSASYTIYGKNEFIFPDEQNPYQDGKLVLVTHSKVRISQDLSTAVETILMANSVGLLPTLSRIWEVLPLSFIVDWFTGMNRRLKLVDSQLAYMAFRTDLCVHSYKLVYYPSSEELAVHGLQSPYEDRPFCISTYAREKSVFMPRLRTSHYDFVGANGYNPIIAGALMWQQI
jgi:hypothetical protein